MELKSTIESLLGLSVPWEVADIQFAKTTKGKLQRVNIFIQCNPDYIFKDKAGNDCIVESTEEKEFKHWNIFENECYLIAKVPKLKTITDANQPISIPWVKENINVSNILHEKIKNKFDEEVANKIEKGHQNLSPIGIIQDSFNLNGFGYDLIGLVPEILCGYIAGGKIRQNVILKYPKHLANLKQRKGVLLCHALSPFSESIGFFCDIGRANRIAKGLKLPLRVMLAGEDWTKFNWVVQDLKLEDNLIQNEEWRKKVYSKLGIQCDTCTIENVKSKFKDLNLKLISNDYLKIVKKSWGENIDKERFNTEQVEELLKKPNDFFDYAALKILEPELKPFKTTISCILRNFHRIDSVTFIYFLTQYYHQSQYKGWLKISMEREKDFDESFKEISESKSLFEQESAPNDSEHLDLTGLYFEDYVYGIYKDGDKTVPLTAHPYYFPSGSIFQYYKDDLNLAKENCLMIYDLTNIKIERHLSQINYFQKARLISDLLSFAHLLSEQNDNVRTVVRTWMKSIKKSTSLWQSWEKFTIKNNDFSSLCRTWTDLAFTSWNNHNNLQVPYHFLPFLWTDFVDVKEEAELIKIILEEARKSFDPSYPILTTDPTKK